MALHVDSVLLQLTSCLWPVCLGCSVSLPAGTGAAEPPPGSASVGSSSDAHSRTTLEKRWHSKGCQSTNSGSILDHSIMCEPWNTSNVICITDVTSVPGSLIPFRERNHTETY